MGDRAPGDLKRPFWLLMSLALGRACMGLHLQTIAPLTPFFIAELGFNYSEIGFLIGLFLAPGLALAFPTTFFAARVGYLRIGLFGMALMAAGSLWLASVDSFAGAAAARLLAGTGGILVNLSLLRLATLLFEKGSMNSSISIVMSAWPVGLGLGAAGYPLLAVAMDWRLIFVGLAIATAISGILIVFFARRETAAFSTAKQARAWSYDRRTLVLASVLGVAFTCFTSSGIIFLSFSPIFLSEGGITLATASAAASLIVWLSILGTPLGGWITDRWSRPFAVIVFGNLLSAGTMLLILGAPSQLFLFPILGILWGLPAAPFTGLLQRELRPESVEWGYGVLFTLFYGGLFALPALAGLLADLTSDLTAPLTLSVGLLVLSVLLLACFRKLTRSEL